jgi:hypothetical protein
MRRPPSALRRVLRVSIPVLELGLLAGALVGCNVDTLPDPSRPAVTNTCTTDKDCGSNGVCTSGACYTRNGTIDEVLLEIIPEPNSPFANISFLSMQDGLRRGAPARSIALPGPVTFQAQVQVNGEDLDVACPYLHTGKQSIPARIQYVRTGTVRGLPVSGLSSRFEVTVDTEAVAAGFSKSVSLVPGFYDIYAKPTTPANCPIAAKIWRGVEVGAVVPSAPPATLVLPTPVSLTGRVTRVGGNLAGWQVELIDRQDGRVISTSARLGVTTDASPATNFALTFQPLDISTTSPNKGQPSASTPLIQMRPPKDAESTAPVVYYDLMGLTGPGPLNLDISKLPATMVTVAGQVQGVDGEGVRSTVRFVNTSIKDDGLPASFGPATATDASGRYTTKLYPGLYHVVIVPEGSPDDGTTPNSGATRHTAITELNLLKIGADSTQTVDLTAMPIRSIQGVATAGPSGVVAQGANLEAYPLLNSSSDVLTGVLFPTTTLPSASVAVNDTNGHFKLVLDPGYYDFALKPAASSNFAWWIFPSVHVLPEAPTQVTPFDPQLPYPVPLGGTITVTMPDNTSQPLRNATLNAYALTPYDGVTQVGMARTDDMGRYYVAIPPDFYIPPP